MKLFNHSFSCIGYCYNAICANELFTARESRVYKSNKALAAAEIQKAKTVNAVNPVNTSAIASHPYATDLDDALDAVDGAAEETLQLGVVVGVIRMTDAHEQDVGRKTRQKRSRALWLQFQDKILRNRR